MADKRTRLSDISRAGKKTEKPTVIGAIRDPQFVRDVMQGLGETATRGITGVLGAPVDITTMAMRPFGYSVPAEQVVGGSEYLGKQLERAGILSGNRNMLSELLAGLVTPDPVDVAKLGAMVVPAVGRAMKAPRDEALKIAQANAAKPVSEGGLGLPPDNTAMDRAKAMGYDVDAYHGTGVADRIGNQLVVGGVGNVPRAGSAYGDALYSSTTPHTANAYALGDAPGVFPLLVNRSGFLDIDNPTPQDYEKLTKFANESLLAEDRLKFDRATKVKEFSNLQDAKDFYAQQKQDWKDFGNNYERIKPRTIKNNGGVPKVEYFDFFGDVPIEKPSQAYQLFGLTGWNNIPELGYKGHTMTRSLKEDWDMTRDTSNIRSRFAAFDPARRYESDLLGAADLRLLGAIGLGTAGAVYKTNREKDKKREK